MGEKQRSDHHVYAWILTCLVVLLGLWIVAPKGFLSKGDRGQEVSDTGSGNSAEGVVPFAETAGLRSLLLSGDVQSFNEARHDPRLAGRTLELSTEGSPLALQGLNLAKVDLSSCLLDGASFNGTDLRGASLGGSRLSKAMFWEPVDINRTLDPKASLPTLVAGADFTGAQLTEEGSSLAMALSYTDASQVLGLPEDLEIPFQSLAVALGAGSPEPFEVPKTGSEIMAQGEPCPNPFAEVPEEDRARWKGWGVDLDALSQLSAVRISDLGLTREQTLVHRDPKTVLVLSGTASAQGDLYSLGPLVVTGEAKLAGQVWVNAVAWFRQSAVPGRLLFGRPILVDPTGQPRRGKAILSPVWLTGDLNAPLGTPGINIFLEDTDGEE